jgi:hypothetical protein
MALVRQQHGIDYVNNTVGLQNIRDDDHGDVAFNVRDGTAADTRKRRDSGSSTDGDTKACYGSFSGTVTPA